jgi:hypothetical protein
LFYESYDKDLEKFVEFEMSWRLPALQQSARCPVVKQPKSGRPLLRSRGRMKPQSVLNKKCENEQ